MAIKIQEAKAPIPPPIYNRTLFSGVRIFNFKVREKKFISSFFKKEKSISRNSVFDLFTDCRKCSNQRFCYIKQKDESGFMFTYVLTKNFKYGRKELIEKYLEICPKYNMEFSNGRTYSVYITIKSLFDKFLLATQEEIRKFNDLDSFQLSIVKEKFSGLCECERFELPREIFSDCFMLSEKDLTWFLKERDSLERHVSKGLIFDWLRYQSNVYAYSKSEGILIAKSIYLTKKFLLEIFLKYAFFKEDLCEVGKDETLVRIAYSKAKITDQNIVFLRARLEMEEEEKNRKLEKRAICRIDEGVNINIDETIYDTYSDTDVW